MPISDLTTAFGIGNISPPTDGKIDPRFAGPDKPTAPSQAPTDRISVTRYWLERLHASLQGPLPSGHIGDVAFFLRDQVKDILEAAPVASCSEAPQTAWKCAARKQGTPGGTAPADCNWPGCGCDPAANKVLEAITEAGFEIVRRNTPSSEGGGPVPAYEFPYSQTFDAICAATEVYPSKEQCLGISISVRKFQEAFNGHRDKRVLHAPGASEETAQVTLRDVRLVLKEHWLTEIKCEHKSKSDQAICWCGWTSAWYPSVGEALNVWIYHVCEHLSGAHGTSEGSAAVILPTKLTGEIACILEDCSPPDKQTPEAVAALIEGYQSTWDAIVAALSAGVGAGVGKPDLLIRARQFVADSGCDEDDGEVNAGRDELLADIDAALAHSRPHQHIGES